MGAGARRAAPRPVLPPAGLQPGAAFQPAGFQALCQLKPGEEPVPNAMLAASSLEFAGF